MTYFMQSGNNFFVSKDRNMPISTVLPAGTYVVNLDRERGFFLSGKESFDVSGRIYGDVQKRVDRIVNTFSDRPSSTGVILAGEKGSGKTMLTKMLSLTLEKMGIVTIIVNNEYAGTAFNDFIATIEQPALVLFDEFEKVYRDQEAQESLLTLFDGIFTTKKLFIVTTNERHALNKYMINRPGRFFYSFNYTGLDRSFIEDYARENLKNQDHFDKFVRAVPVAYDPVNFDMLKALVEEMNRYDEDLFEVTKYVNVNETKHSHEYVLKSVTVKTPDHEFVRLYERPVNAGRAFAPFANAWNFYYIANYKDDDTGKILEDTEESTFYPKNIIGVAGDTVTYENDEFRVTVEKAPIEVFNMHDYL